MSIWLEQLCLLAAAAAVIWGLLAARAIKTTAQAVSVSPDGAVPPALPATPRYPRLLALAAAVGWIALRGILRRHAPFANMYESLSFFGLLYVLKCFWGQRRCAWWLYLPGLVMLTIALLLPLPQKLPGVVPAALQSFWIFIHVPAYFIGYVSLTMAAVYALLPLLRLERSRPAGNWSLWNQQLQRELEIAWFFCSVGLITGAIWADISWGRFWSWDPKESWALVTWLLTAAALHAGRWPRARRILALIAFLAMLYTYFGVAFFASGLHSYV